MKFIDEVTIRVQAGKGGDGCCSFRREKFIPFGGPDGGDGGRGGDLYLKSTSKLSTLIDLNYRKFYKAENGKAGSGNLRSGKSGQDLVIEVPLGTVVKAKESGEVIGDLATEDQLLLVATGGKGGLGNHNFKSSTNRAPRRIIKGSLGEELDLHLELRLLADVGLLGLPNAGKSTLINKVSAAKSKVGAYPFTTLEPRLGVVKCRNSSFVMADIPGILQGAASGIGLGIKFLKHLARNKLLLHMVDLAAALATLMETQPNSDHSSKDISRYVELHVEELIQILYSQIEIIDHEISGYNDLNLKRRVRWIVINKIDLLASKVLDLLRPRFEKFIKGRRYGIDSQDLTLASAETNSTQHYQVFWISAINGLGVDALAAGIASYLKKSRYIVVE